MMEPLMFISLPPAPVESLAGTCIANDLDEELLGKADVADRGCIELQGRGWALPIRSWPSGPVVRPATWPGWKTSGPGSNTGLGSHKHFLWQPFLYPRGKDQVSRKTDAAPITRSIGGNSPAGTDVGSTVQAGFAVPDNGGRLNAFLG